MCWQETERLFVVSGPGASNHWAMALTSISLSLQILYKMKSNLCFMVVVSTLLFPGLWGHSSSFVAP